MVLNNDKLTALEKSILVLTQLAKEPYSYTVLEISKELGINRSTVHRILSTFKKHMFVLQCPNTKKYKLGPMSYHVGSAYLYRNNYMDDIFKIIDDTAEELKLSVGYSILDDDKIINLYENEHYISIRMGYRGGFFYPIHCGVYGKTIMAFYKPIEKLKEIVYSTILDKRNENTISDPDELLKEYEQIRKQGYAISDEENVKGAIGVGAPVFNSEGNIVGCVGAAGIKVLITPEELENVKRIVIDAANKINKLIP